ncbi:LuxR C-terminal-related transcriptional regulator [Streptomyces sp. NPDC001941]|uniref:helix-turn-helix transcriptional regulator n=1 Tax=Streptomyces sp. NPDC001941 TaxID=3154659 RepID=UPI0033177485
MHGIFRTKFSPRPPDALVARPRLDQRLDAGIAGHLTAVVGPPGTGKSCQLASWIRTSTVLPRARAWLTLDEEDNDLTSLAEHLAATIAGSGAVDRAALAGAAAPDRIASGLVDALATLPEPLLLVLDDFHELSGPARSTVLGLIRHAPPRLKVVLGARREPELGLHRLRATGAVTEIRAEDLAFTREEARELFLLSGIDHDDGTLDAILECSGGWAVGLRCAALAREDAEPWTDCLEVRARAGGLCSDFFVRELLERLPEDEVDLLVRTSASEHLDPALARALTGRPDAGRALRRLATERDLLVPCGASRYRHHPLLLRVLHRELTERSTPAELAALEGTVRAWRAGTAAPVRQDAPGPSARPTPVRPADRRAPVGRPERLTSCELEVLRLLRGQRTLEEIAAGRHVSVNTVKTQVKGVYRKFGVTRRRDAVALAEQWGLLDGQ